MLERMKTDMKRLMACLACLTLLLCLLPSAALAAEGDISLSANYKAEDGSLTISWNTLSARGYRLGSATVNDKTVNDPQTKDGNGVTSFTVTDFGAVVGTNTIECEFLPETEGEDPIISTLNKKLETEDLLGFTFSDPEPMYNSSSGAFSLTYTPQTAGVEIVSIEVDNNVSYRANDNQGKVTATISNLGYGSHSLTYYFQTPGNSSVPFTSSRKLERAGTLTIQMKLSVENGLVVATLTDQNGEPVVDYPVDLYLSGVKQRSQQSDSSGRVTFNVAAPDDRSTVRCVAPSRKIGSVSYVGCEEYLATPTTTRPTDGTTAGRPTTTGKTNGSTTGSSTDSGTTTTGTPSTQYPTVTAAGTTATGDGFIAVSTTFDTGIASAFGLSETEFSSRVRLLMEPTYYQALVGSTTDITPVLSMRSSSLKADTQAIAAAIAASDALKGYSANDATSITFDLSAYLLSSTDQSMLEVSLPEGKLKLEIPVPKSMEGRELAIAVITDDGLQTPALVTADNGIITVEINRLASLTLLSFPKAEEEAQGLPVFAIVLIVVGVVLVVGAGVLIFFFFIKKPKKPDPEGEGASENPDGPSEETGVHEDNGEPEKTEETPEEPLEQENADAVTPSELERTMVLDFPPESAADTTNKPAVADKKPPVPGVSLGSFVQEDSRDDQSRS